MTLPSSTTATICRSKASNPTQKFKQEVTSNGFEKNEGSRPARPRAPRPQEVCSFCVDRIDEIDYKDVARLRKYVSERAKIIPRRVTVPAPIISAP